MKNFRIASHFSLASARCVTHLHCGEAQWENESAITDNCALLHSVKVQSQYFLSLNMAKQQKCELPSKSPPEISYFLTNSHFKLQAVFVHSWKLYVSELSLYLALPLQEMRRCCTHKKSGVKRLRAFPLLQHAGNISAEDLFYVAYTLGE